MLAVVGIGVVLAGFFQYNPDELAAMSTRGHKIATRVMMVSTLLGLPLTSRRLSGEERWSGYRRRLVPVGIAVLLGASFVLYVRSIPTYPTGWAGLAQRTLFAVVAGWLAFHAFTRYRLTRRDGSAP